MPITSIIQLIGGYLHQTQALFLIENLKLGQYGKLSPRCTFMVQTLGTVSGACINYILMTSIITNQREILLSIEGSNIWSGQVIQSFNSNVSHPTSQEILANDEGQAIAFGVLSKYMLALGAPTNGSFFPCLSDSSSPSLSISCTDSSPSSASPTSSRQ